VEDDIDLSPFAFIKIIATKIIAVLTTIIPDEPAISVWNRTLVLDFWDCMLVVELIS
jgi:hypothetical protein